MAAYGSGNAVSTSDTQYGVICNTRNLRTNGYGFIKPEGNVCIESVCNVSIAVVVAVRVS
jgi:hypothetical protein